MGTETAAPGESWFLEQLERDPVPAAELMAWLQTCKTSGQEKLSDSSADLLQDTLRERGALDQALDVLTLRARWHGAERTFRNQAPAAVTDLLGNSPEVRALVEQAGFSEAGVATGECFRRLQLLRAMTPGVLCFDKTWGIGKITGIDYFYKRIAVDFEKKSGHQLAMGYAAETLELLPADHLMSLHHREPDRLRQMVADQPAEVVRITLRSCGPLPVSRMQELLVPRIVAADDWKRFWDKARGDLKKDLRVEIPKSRNDPLRLLQQDKGITPAWFARLAATRKMEDILGRVAEFRLAAGTEPQPPEHLAVLAERLAFVIIGAGNKHSGLMAQAMIAADDLGLQTPGVDLPDRARQLMAPALFVATTARVPARDLPRFLRYLMKIDRTALLDLLVQMLPKLQMTALSEAMDLLLAEGQEARCAAAFRTQTVERQVAEVEMIYWLCRHRDRMETWRLGTIADLTRWMFRVLGKEYNGEQLKAQNQLRAQFDKKEWLQILLDGLDPTERRELMRLVKESGGWLEVDRRSVLGAIIKLDPTLLEVMVAAPEEIAAQSAPRGPITSHRSYHERQRQLEKIVTVDIPQVAREIGKAREYGDLSENFEYKAAKDKQALLLRRQGEINAMLHAVTPSAFTGLPHDQAGVGTGVRIRHADGREELFYILGAWDRDETLGIISNDSGMAQALQGHRAGDTVQVPTAAGPQSATVTEVTGLPDAIHKWINSDA